MMKQPDEEDPEARTHRRVLSKRMLGLAAVAAVALSATTYLAALASSEANGGAIRMRTSTQSAAAGGTLAPGASVAPAPPAPVTSEAPGPGAKPDAHTPLPPEQAAAVAKKFLDSSIPVDPAAADSKSVLGNAASGAILAEVENDAQELEANGWTRQGSATVEALTIVSSDSSSDPATVIAQACIDSSKVITLDNSGNPVGNSAGTVQRALNVYTLQSIAGVWKVVARTFPDNPTC